MNRGKDLLKNLLGELPYTAEVYWYLRQRGQPLTAKFSLARLKSVLPEWRLQAEAARPAETGKHIFIFGVLRYWIEHAALLAAALAGQGHRVTLSYLPYAQWQVPMDRFNLRRHNAYAYSVLRLLEPLVKVQPLLGVRPVAQLPEDLDQAIQAVALRDTQYTLQVEQVSVDSDLHLQGVLRVAQRQGCPPGLCLDAQQPPRSHHLAQWHDHGVWRPVPDRPPPGHPGDHLRVWRAAPAHLAGAECRGDAPGNRRPVGAA